MSFLGTRRRLLGIAAAGLAALAGGAAYAAIPDAGGVIHACYNALGDGLVRVIDPDRESCRFGENAISWTGSGPVGPGALSAIHQVTSSHDLPTPVPAGATWFADCPSGEVAVGGGGLIERFGEDGFTDRLPIYGSVPYLADPQGWIVTAGPAPGKGHITITVYVSCVEAG